MDVNKIAILIEIHSRCLSDPTVQGFCISGYFRGGHLMRARKFKSVAQAWCPLSREFHVGNAVFGCFRLFVSAKLADVCLNRCLWERAKYGPLNNNQRRSVSFVLECLVMQNTVSLFNFWSLRSNQTFVKIFHLIKVKNIRFVRLFIHKRIGLQAYIHQVSLNKFILRQAVTLLLIKKRDIDGE